MNILKLLIAICSVLFLLVGFDKFVPLMEPQCSLKGQISPILWRLLGGLQLAAGILIWSSKLRKYVAGFFIPVLIFFTAYHLKADTYDIGGSIFMAILLGIILWNPEFLKVKKT
ncbi:MAG: hypothetical protein ED556_08760 [Winogradskyella sp.]|uniref:hypothetical protein n=1 Tax=Winogradskyella sp. TaxID=1883156 RepID=UPI000F410DF0|nr:hypothetical protein [Winogradskyella sp.]RNC86373.1 MAG: hypothetical protein ED556_08760 [Winogradskyella sp.]